MGCAEVREKLNDYIEGIVVGEEKTHFDEHFKSCEECRKALASLEKTVGLLRNLDEKEPPPWMTQKVMSRVRSETKPGEGLLRKLFYPLYVKLPIEAFGIILIAVSAFYIFKTMQPEIKLAQAPLENSMKQQTTQGELREKEPLELSGTGEMPSDKGKGIHALPDKKAAQEESTGVPAISKESSFADKQAGASAPVPARNDKISSTVPPSFDAHSDKSASSVQKAIPSATKKDAGLILTVFVQKTDRALEKLEKIIGDLGGTIIRKDSIRDRYTITVHFKTINIPAFHDRLSETGDVQESKESLTAYGSNNEVSIDILLVRKAPE